MAFSRAQTEAILHGDGPALILAGPGSGKTTVITNRILTLRQKYGIPGSNILVITFTRAAAEEMKNRFLAAVSADMPFSTGTDGITFGTFHSVFFRILRYAYQYDASSIITEKEQFQTIEGIIDALGLDAPDYRELASNLLGEISCVKSNCLSLSHYYAKSCPENDFRRVFQMYEKELREKGKVDFDDILTMTWELLSKRPDICASWQAKYQYILIDEFQDINLIQYQVIRLLAAPKNNLFVVGDDDQSIYRFRGARPEIMLGFEKDYPAAKRILLDINFRSDAYIIAAADRLIRHNQARFEKHFRPFHEPRHRVLLKPCKDIAEQNRAMVRQLREYHEQGYAYESMAVLFRTNLGGRFLMDSLMKNAIPFHMKDTLPNLFTHWIALDVIAYLRIVSGTGNTRANWLRIINRPNRYIRREAFAPLTSQIRISDLRGFYAEKDWMLERLDRLEYDLNIMNRMPPYAAIHYLSTAMHYEDYLKEYANTHHLPVSELTDVLHAVKESASSCSSFQEWFSYITAYTEELKAQVQKGRQSQEGVCLCTLHCAKGLEYSVVLIPDVNEENIPHVRAALDSDLEEERRLFYVGMTRAKEHLHLYCITEQTQHQKPPSRFLKEIQSGVQSLSDPSNKK